MKIGSHVGLSGNDKFLGSVKEALSYGANTFMVYTGAPQNTRRSPIDTYKIEEATALMKEHGMGSDDVIIHAPYIVNLANPGDDKREFAVTFLTEEVRRSAQMGAKQMVLHPGAAVGGDRQLGLDYIVQGVKQILENTKDLDVKIALETMAGKGTELGKTFEEIGYLVNNINHERISVCFDTCHTNDAGYDLTKFDQVIEEFDRLVGKERISVFHINDSKNERGAAKDRHENFGFGTIGFDTLLNVVNHPDFKEIPKILETPYVTESEDSKDKVYPPYKHEITMIQNGVFERDLLTKIRNK